MIDETEVPAEEEIQETEETTTTEETTETEAVTEEETEVELTEEEKKVEATKKRQADKNQKRFNKVFRRAKEAETDNARLKEELAKYQTPVEPKPDDFEDQNDYINAKVAFEVNKTKPQEVTTQAFDINPVLQQGREKYSDFDTVVTNNASLPITEEMAQMISEAENGIDIFYHLGKNPIEMERISLLDPTGIARELGRLEARLSIPSPRTTQTPKPVKPLSDASSQPVDVDKMSMTQYVAYRNKQQYG